MNFISTVTYIEVRSDLDYYYRVQASDDDYRLFYSEGSEQIYIAFSSKEEMAAVARAMLRSIDSK